MRDNSFEESDLEEEKLNNVGKTSNLHDLLFGSTADRKFYTSNRRRMKKFIKWTNIDKELPLPLKQSSSLDSSKFQTMSCTPNRMLLDPIPHFAP